MPEFSAEIKAGRSTPKSPQRIAGVRFHHHTVGREALACPCYKHVGPIGHVGARSAWCAGHESRERGNVSTIRAHPPVLILMHAVRALCAREKGTCTNRVCLVKKPLKKQEAENAQTCFQHLISERPKQKPPSSGPRKKGFTEINT